MIKLLIKATFVGILGARTARSVVAGMTNTTAALLTVSILFTVGVGLSPLLAVAADAARAIGSQEGTRG